MREESLSSSELRTNPRIPTQRARAAYKVHYWELQICKRDLVFVEGCTHFFQSEQ